MASPRLICKSAYITSIEHFLNSIEYAGNKIDKQEIVYRDGSIKEVEGDKPIKIIKGDESEVLGVRITFKNGEVSRPFSYDRYLTRVGVKGERVTVSQVSEVRDDAQAFGIEMPQVDDTPRNLWDMSFDKYIGYIANREGVVKEEGHGLFGLGGNIPIDEAKALALEHEDSRKWSHIISMDAEDAKSTGYDNREMWKHLIVAKAPEIAKAYNIGLQNLIINCAYHGNTDNPHVHLMFYSKDHTEGFVKGGVDAMNKATEKLKSTLVGEIFKGENASLGAEKEKLRKKIMQTLKLQVGELMKEPLGADVMDKIEALSVKLETVQGKKKYEWLPPELKQEVDDVLRTAVESSPQLTQAFDEYSRMQEKLIARYVMSPGRLEEKLAQWKDSFFHPSKSDLRQHHNIIVGAAANIEETRSQWLRTFGEENVHVNTADESLSSPSAPEVVDEPPDSVPEPDYLLQSEPALERTFGEKMFDFDTSKANLSSSKFDFAQEQPELATIAYLDELQNSDPVQEAFRSTLRKATYDKSFQAPLKKLLRKHLDDCLLDTEFFSSAIIKDKLERLHVNDDTGKCAEIVSCLYQTSEEFRRTVDNHIGVLYDKLKAVMKPAVAAEYADKYREELLGGEYLPMHGSIKWYAQTLPENYYRLLCKKHKEIFKPLNFKIIKGLWENIGNPQSIKELRELALSDPADTNQIDTKVRDIVCGVVQEDELCQFTESMAVQFKEAISETVDPNAAQSFYERMRSDIYTAQLSSTSFIVQSFAAELDNHLAEAYLKQQLKNPAVRQFRSELYQSMARLHKKGGAQVDRLQLLSMYSGDRKCYNEIIEILSPDNGDSLPLLQQKLYQTLFDDYCMSANPPLDYDEFGKVVDSFFYGENGNTFFIQEVVQQSAADTALPLPAFFIAKSMLSMLVRSIAGAAAHQAPSQEENHSFATHKQFRGVKFKQPETFIQQY